MKKIIFFALVLSVLSCSDFMRTESVEQITIDTQLKNKKGITEALYGAYIDLRSVMFFEQFAVYGDLQSGNLTFTPNTSGNVSVLSKVANMYDFDDLASSSDMKYFYANTYAVINNINLILSKVDEISDATETEKKQIKAEALAMRAFLHFQLAKIYAQNYSYTTDASHLGIVYNDRVLKVGVDYPSRKSVKETFDLLEKDITQAIDLMQDTKAISVGLERNFIGKATARAIAADIFLWKNDWQKAYDYSTEVIENYGLTLSDYSDVKNWASTELIFELPNTANNDSPISAIYSVASGSRPNYNLSKDVYNTFETSDKRLNLLEIRNYRTAGYTATQPYYFSKKYAGNVNNAVYRLSEMYFIRAEAGLHLGKNTEALSDINKIKNRVGISEIHNLTIDEILSEKRKEFLFENKYFFDLVRNHQNIEQNSCLGNNCNMSYPNDKFVLPIPKTSLDLNTNMKQNPSY